MTLPPPPVARREPRTLTQMGRTRTDDYAWMKDENWQAVMRDPALLRDDIRVHLTAENAYTAALMAETAPLQERLFQEMRGRIKENDESPPLPDGPWNYYTRFETGAQHPIYARRPRGRADGEQILLDVETQAKGHAFYKVSHAQHAPDHSLIAWSLDAQGSEYFEIRVRDLATGADFPSPIQSADGDFVFSPDSRYLFWVFRDEHGRPKRVYRRPVRGARGDDTLVYEEPDEGFFLSVGVSEDRACILISSGNQEQSETHFIPAETPEAAPILFHPREDYLIYEVSRWDGRWIVRTNADGAVDFKIATCEDGATGRAHWRDLIAHAPGRYISDAVIHKGHFVRIERVNASPRIVIRDLAGEEHIVPQDEDACALGIEQGYEYDTSILRFTYTSPTTPRSWFDYDMAARARTRIKTQEIPSGHDPAAYETRRLWAEAPDGALVPITLLMKRGTPLDGSAPLLLYGYGAYGHALDADFSIRRLSLVDRGWVYALAHVRGGAEKGRAWFLDGRKEKKPNTFTDFIACAETLIAAGYTRAGRIVAEGRSAGGLLMGAIANLRPDLWAGVIAGVPFVDVLNTMSDASLPLTPPEWPEWGDPLNDETAYDQILAYSPYDNVAARAYPAILASGGLSDPRVTYWEPAKWAAKLRANSASARPILLKINMEAGHAGAAGRFDFLRELAFDYAFALKAVGAAEAGGGF